MADFSKRLLKVFLCHASADKPTVRNLYKRLLSEGVDAWLDQEKLLPGQDWRREIPRAVSEADVVVVCLSGESVTKEGFVQTEIGFALDIAKEKPEGTIFLIPTRLEDCAVPDRLSRWQWVDLFEDDGYLKLLRSLKLRADRVGAVIEPPAYEYEEDETEKRLDQLYMDGLAAFYTQDWDRACKRFQAILLERPSHKNASEKLAEAERNRNLAKLYSQATEAYKSENWLIAIKILDELLQKSADYEDSVQLLKSAKKQNQLKELYEEAKALHTAEKWQAVVKVFEKILTVEPTYSDRENLLSSAQKEVAELKRLEHLHEHYSQGLREMDAGHWYEARQSLEQVHKEQTGFLETEALLRKAENEILKIEELNKRNMQINTLYEQARGQVRSENWREALEKIEDIQKLNADFEDHDGIAKQARIALEREERKVQKQNQLAAMYAEAIRLLKEGYYQEALNKWHEIKEIDPKYPDRQKVQIAARRKIAEGSKQPITKRNIAWRGLGLFLFLGLLLLFLTIRFGVPLLAPPIPTPTVTKLPTPTIVPTQYLTKLRPTSINVGHETLGVGKYPFTEGSAVLGEVLKANGVEYPHGLFAHAPSEVTYILTKNYNSFSSSIYMDGYTYGSYTCAGLAVFIVLIDDKEVYRSSGLSYSEPIKLIEIPEITIDGGKKLTLVTDSLGNSDCDWTVWADPHLTP